MLSASNARALAGVLLAGGLARRMGGGDKSLKTLGGLSILERIVAKIRPQVDYLMINANGDASRFASYGLPVRADVVGGHRGPLAGILTGMDWAADEHPECRHVLSFATDAPFLPDDLAERLHRAVEDGADLACAESNGRAHPVFGIWPVGLRDALRRAMVEEDMRTISSWTARYHIRHVSFDVDPVDPFFNVNKPDNLIEAEAMLSAVSAP